VFQSEVQTEPEEMEPSHFIVIWQLTVDYSCGFGGWIIKGVSVDTAKVPHLVQALPWKGDRSVIYIHIL
jgi:hypothetical protein